MGEEEVRRQLAQARRQVDRLQRQRRLLLQALQEERARSSALEGEVGALRSSPAFRLLVAYQRSLERLAPPRTGRRRRYQDMVRGLRGPARVTTAPTAPPVPPLPTSSVPEASILIPVHGRWPLTAACLRSIAADPTIIRYEVIVADDGSKDETAAELAKVVGLRVVRLETNRGYVHAVNSALPSARGRYVVLLNNDTEVQPGWLDALVGMADDRQDVAVVGAKLIYPDGRLQEAGCIVWADGYGTNYGRGGDPRDHSVDFPREVDYCSGACLLVRRDLLQALGGLDARFAPAYYEDADLAFAARQRGLRVLYQPAAVVRHAEGASYGAESSGERARILERHRELFRIKWRSELASQAPNHPDNLRLASWRVPQGRALVMDHQLPTPDQDSGSRRMFELLLLLAGMGFGVTFVPHDGADLPPYSRLLLDNGIEVMASPAGLPGYLRQVAPDLRAAILSRPAVASSHLPTVRRLAPEAKVLYDTVDLHFLRERRQAEVEDDPSLRASAERYHDQELSLARSADATLVVSPTEREVLLAEDPTLAVHVVPNIHTDEPAGLAFGCREGLLFVGNFRHPPNRDAAHWLVEEVLTFVRKQLPAVPTYIVGSHATSDILELAGEGVEVLGWVPDLGDLYDRSRLFVAPLRYGAGIKGKVGESLAHGLPVVTTHLGAEGMGLEHGTDVLVADGAEAFAGQIVRGYQDQELWERLAANGRSTVSRQYSPETVRGLLSTLLAELGVLAP
jgi:GT2 family glycosyltransferase